MYNSLPSLYPHILVFKQSLFELLVVINSYSKEYVLYGFNVGIHIELQPLIGLSFKVKDSGPFIVYSSIPPAKLALSLLVLYSTLYLPRLDADSSPLSTID